MQAFLLKLVIQHAIPVVFNLLAMGIKKLVERSDTTVDDAFAKTFTDNKDKIVEEVQNVAKDKLNLNNAQKG